MKKFVVYETIKIEYPEHNYIGKSSADKVSCSGYLGSGKHFKNAISKYGKNAFEIRILGEYNTEEEAYEAEEKFIEEMNPYYNIAAGGRGVGSGDKNPMYGKKRPALSELNRQRTGEKSPMYGRSGDKNPMYGKPNPIVAEMNRKRTGKNNPRYGKQVSAYTLEEVKEAILKTGSYLQASKLLNITDGAVHRRIKKAGLRAIFDGHPFSKKSKIIGFEEVGIKV